MSLQELKAAVERLPPEEYAEFLAWLDQFQADLEIGATRGKRPRPYGLAAGRFTAPDDFDDPLPVEILRLFEGEGKDK